MKGLGLTTFCVIIGLCAEISDSARILGIFPTSTKSHYVMYNSIMRELVNRGHNVTIASPFPMSSTRTNLTHIQLKDTDEGDFNVDILNSMTLTENVVDTASYCTSTCERLLGDTAIVSLVKPEDYDLFVTEIFGTECFTSVGHKLGIPSIGLVSSIPYPWVNDMTGNPDSPAYIPNYYSAFTSRMNFAERVLNTLTIQWSKVLYEIYSNWPSQKISEAVFGPLPSMRSLSKNYSMILINSHFSINQVRPWMQQMVEIGGVHIPKTPDPLPKDLEEFMSESPHGVVFFSFGTIVPTNTIPEEKLRQIISVLGSLKQRVVWKINGTALPNLPHNIKTGMWMPQLSILCHPNTKLFIGHGGLLGLQEAINCGVPILGVPIFADQRLNLVTLRDKGAAEILEYPGINDVTLYTLVNKILMADSYRENAVRLSRIFKDRPLSAMDTAIYWFEYVLKYNGADHLKSAVTDLSWYQELLLDVAVFLLISFVAMIFVAFYVVKMLLAIIKSSFIKTKNNIKEKKYKSH